MNKSTIGIRNANQLKKFDEANSFLICLVLFGIGK
jgi:hypothetical protein